MTTNINTSIEVSSEAEALKVKEALDFMAKVFKAGGIIKMQQVYESDVFIRKIVKETLGIK